MKRLILIFVVAVFGSAAMWAGDNGWRLGVTANKSVMASGQTDNEPHFWSIGGEVSYLWNPVWRLTLSPVLGVQYMDYSNRLNGSCIIALGVDAGVKLGYGFSVLTGPAVRYGTRSKDYISDYGKNFTAYWGFGLCKEFMRFYISAKYYQCMSHTKPNIVASSFPGQEVPDMPKSLCKNYLNFSIGYKF